MKMQSTQKYQELFSPIHLWTPHSYKARQNMSNFFFIIII